MSVYLRHYWSLYADFADAFGEIVYRKIPLPLLINFYQYLSEDARRRMEQPAFQAYLRNGIVKNVDIQPIFERFLATCRDKPRTNVNVNVNGKVLINGTYHRFQPRVFMEYFHPKRTLLLSRGKPYLGIPIVTLSHYEQDVSQEAERIRGQADSILNDWAGHPVFGEPFFRDKLLKETPRIIQTLDAAERMLASNPVSCILVGTTEDLTSRALALAGGKLGIPSICLQHGVIMGEEAFLPVFATIQAVYGKYEADWYAARGVTSEAVKICGHPRYDAIFTRVRDRPTKKVSKQKGSMLEGSVQDGATQPGVNLLMATQPATNRPLWVEAIRLLTTKLPNARILIRPHPWEIKKGLLAEYEALAAKLAAVEVVPAEADLYELLDEVDLVVVENSTVGLEAMLSGKPVLIFRNPKEKKDYPYYNGMAPYITTDPQELSELAVRALNEPASAAELKQLILRFVRRAYPVKLAGRQLARLIAELTDERPARGHSIFPEGMLLQAGDHKPGVICGGKLRPFASMSAFQSGGHKWDDVLRLDERLADRIPAGEPIEENEAPLANQGGPPAILPETDGLLIRGKGPQTYMLEDGLKRPVAAWIEEALDSLVLEADDRWLSRIPTGLPIYKREGERHRP